MTPGVSISALFEAAHDAVLLADGAGTVLGVNTAAERLFGYPRDELIGRRVGELLIAEELGVPVETAVVRKDGVRVDVEVAFARADDTFVAFVRDLSKEREHSGLIEDLDAIVWEFDALRRRVTYINARATELLGYPAECWTEDEDDAFWISIIHPDDQHNVRALRDGLPVGKSFELEYRARTLDGRWRRLRDFVRLTRDENGTVVRARGVAVDITDQQDAAERVRRTNEALHVQQHAFRELVGDVEALIWEWDIAEGRYTFASGGFERVIGRPPPLEPIRAELDAAVARGDASVQIEYDHETGKGRTIVLRNSIRIIRDEHGRATRFRGVATDVTELRHAEAKVRAHESRFRRLVEHLPLAIHESTVADGRVLYISPQIEQILGYPHADWYERGFFQKLLHPDDSERVSARSAEARETGLFHDEYRLFSRDGRTVWIEHAAIQVEQENGEPIVQGYLHDITERKIAEERRLKAEERFRSLVENLPLVTYTNAMQGEIETLYMSPQVEEILGYTPAEWVANAGFFEGLLHPDDHDAVIAAVVASHSTGVQFAEEYRLRTKDGRYVWVHDESTPVRDAAGEVAYIQGYFSDVTQRKELEQQLLQAQKMEAVGRLAGGIAHDFNNLLTAIGGYAEFLLGGLSEDDPLREGAAEIARATDRAASLTRQLLAFSRRQVLQPRSFDLNEVVGDMEGMLRRLIGDEVVLELEPGDGVLQVRADPNQIEQVILNLVVNARDAMPDGGSIRIRTFAASHESAPGEYSVLEVSDTGVGMTSEILGQLFDPFFTTKEKGKGTGLGLATVYGIVKQSGGDISVRSVVDEGSSFRIYLPQASDQDASGVDSVRPGGGTECVLLVEDEDAVRALVRETLRRYGYEVTDAADADAAREALKSLRPDILVTDIVMPGIGGHELAALVRERHPTVAVLYMSGYSDDAIVRSTLADPRSVFLQKPFGAETLARKVREALDARERV